MKLKVLTVFLSVFFLFPGASMARGALPEFADLIEEISPAVVKITTVSTVGSPATAIPDDQDIPEFFRRYFDPRQMPERNVGGMGSGFIISKDGYILTNNHVIDGANEITVRMTDRREYTAEVVGADPRSDLALLKIEAEKLPFLQFSKDDSLRVGDWVLAIGSPFGMDFSASQGIVSAIGRSIQDRTNGSYVPFIQTDVAINPGNSGGPLFNLEGKVVGINSQIYTRSGGYMGLSFAIPAGLAESVVAQLKDKGHVDRGWLGVSIGDVDKDLARAFGLKRPRGALIQNVAPNGPAEKSGLRPGDIILEFNNAIIDTSKDLPPVVGDTTPESTVPVVVMREGREKSVRVTVGMLDAKTARIPVASATQKSMPNNDRLGLVVEAADEELKRSIGINGGVMIISVGDEGPGKAAGLQRGDVIVQLGFKDVLNQQSYNKIVAQLPSGSLLPIRFYRRGQPAFRTIMIKD
ncbi:MAG: Do family serine endopeptidase [Cellvibrionaceae bacterium]